MMMHMVIRQEADRKVYLLPFFCLVFVLVPALILINIKWLQKQLGELHGAEILAAAVVLLQFLQFISTICASGEPMGCMGGVLPPHAPCGSSRGDDAAAPAAVMAGGGLVRRWAVGHHGSLQQPRRRRR